MSLPVDPGQQELDPIEQGLTDLGGIMPEEPPQEQTEPNPDEQVMGQALIMLVKEQLKDIIPEATKDQLTDMVTGFVGFGETMESEFLSMIFKAYDAAVATREKKKMEGKVGLKLQFGSTATNVKDNGDSPWGMSEEEASEFLRSNIRNAGY